jgi:hypothetical protein
MGLDFVDGKMFDSKPYWRNQTQVSKQGEKGPNKQAK